MPRGGPRPNSGRKRGSRNKRSAGIEAYARGVVEDPEVQDMMMKQAKQGTLPPPIMSLLFHYCYGKPMERIEHSGNPDKPLILEVRRKG